MLFKRMSNFQNRTIIFPRPSPLFNAPMVRNYLEQQGRGIGDNPARVNIRGSGYSQLQRTRQLENLFSNPAVATLVENPVSIRATPVRTSQAGGVIEYVEGAINPQTGNRMMIPRIMNNTAFSDTLPPLARAETIPEYLSRIGEEERVRRELARISSESVFPNFP